MNKFERVKFAFPYDSLDPNIDAKTMEIHSEKHHEGYTTKLNAAVEGTDLADYTIEELLGDLDSIPEEKRITIRNNGGGFANHNLYFSILSPEGGGEPTGELMDAINNKFGGFSKFKEEFTNAGLAQFGSGWAFLALDENGENLHISKLPNQDSPLMENHIPILGVDVWEHAYYLNYQNKRAGYLEAIWNVINWSKVSELYQEAKK